ncbi:collagen binding domain-containing protein [Pseudolysinimonas yzui]|uniref:alpha-amylase n=1 Tax=Pseudolysinimonas yzui TaxID=2708254 RepID=A0A8J3M192_9MICO|nr:carboxypeptidase regulatory-like domain-containing protein [Pseudolysinimonas yzui]GHF20317.1 hypothetical protein GCM10011600_21590 [Pseudolysinimonas yzui]
MTVLLRPPRAIVAALVAALALALLPALPAQAVGPGTATLTLTRGGEPVPYTSLIVFGPEGPTFGFADAAGVIALTDLALGTYSGTVGGGFEDQPAPVSFTLTDAEPAYFGEVEIFPWPSGTGSIAGTAIDAATGAALEGVTISMNQVIIPNGRSFPAQYTPADGTFAYGDLPAGTFLLSAYLPGYFTVMTQTVELADGEAAVVPISLIARDAAITGRVVDGEGSGVEGVIVSAQSGTNADAATTDADGYYTITALGIGTWSLGLGGSGWPWNYTSVEVELDSGETLTAPDLVAVPRTTGSISGLVAGSDQTPEWAGLADICVQVVEADGAVVGAAFTTTPDGYFFFDSIAPGDYSVLFEDCDAARIPHYATTYLGGSATIAGATIVTVDSQADVWLDYTFIDRQTAAPEPEHDATPVLRHDLDAADEDLIEAPSAIRRDETAEVVVGTEYAGQWVSAWLHSHPTQLGEWHQVSPEGTIEVTVPTNHPLGIHELVVQDADDAVIGWTDLRVLQRVR